MKTIAVTAFALLTSQSSFAAPACLDAATKMATSILQIQEQRTDLSVRVLSMSSIQDENAGRLESYDMQGIVVDATGATTSDLPRAYAHLVLAPSNLTSNDKTCVLVTYSLPTAN